MAVVCTSCLFDCWMVCSFVCTCVGTEERSRNKYSERGGGGDGSDSNGGSDGAQHRDI